VLDDLVTGDLGDIVIAYQEEDLAGIRDFQPCRPEKHLDGAIGTVLVGIAVDYLMQDEAPTGVFAQGCVIDNPGEVLSMPVDIACEVM